MAGCEDLWFGIRDNNPRELPIRQQWKLVATPRKKGYVRQVNQEWLRIKKTLHSRMLELIRLPNSTRPQ
jgi:hypothetical protein